ncbi:MAG: phosphomethylpyrimidine synthase ThiC [Clostridiaceae bacterium]|jgi:phosphomethylpyrimidine synthase|nr:phosphomethylpyrimidine synthase ThiC [Clostridiaceae bacterium]
MSYKTQMEAARKGIITPEIEIAARDEYISAEELRVLLANGSAVIPKNINHKAGYPKAIGGTLHTKINVNLGASKDCHNFDVELAKVRKAESLGADAIMDLSTFGDTRSFRRKLAAECKAALGSVPIYDALVYYDKDLADITSDEWLEVVKIHAQDGIDFLTIHAGMNLATAARFKYNRNRLTNIVSRGGSLMFAWMEMTGHENPFFERYDELLDICREYDVTLSLGDACRPGCTHDASDATQIEELITLGELTKRAWKRDVQVMIEGPGHMPLDQIAANIKLQQTLCHGAPYYVLGPLVTDIAPDYDHITSAIGGTVAAASGAAFLCYVTPAEHLRLPNEQDVHDGIIAAKIAAHAGDIAKKIPHAAERDNEMSRARQEVNWEKMFSLAIDPERARKIHEEAPSEVEGACTMCGNMCSMRNMNKILNGEKVTAK